MALEIPPRGTRGRSVPRWLFRLFSRMSNGQLEQYRRTGGAGMTLNGMPLVLLTTIGAKSGERRSVLINRFPDGDSTSSWIVTATAGGSASHPAWFINLAKHPDQVWVEMDHREIHVQPEILRGDERTAAYARISELAPNFAGYPSATDREIPVVRLTATT